MKGDFAGTGKVFKFTVAQLFKSKANIISLIIIIIYCLVALPLITLFTSDDESDSSSFYANIDSLYYIDNSGYCIAPDISALSAYVSVKEVQKADFTPEEFEVRYGEENAQEEQSDEEGCDVLLVFIKNEDSLMPHCVLYSADNEETESIRAALSPYLSSLMYVAYLRSAGIDESSISRLMAPAASNVYTESEYLSPDEDEEIIGGFMVQDAYSLILMLLITFTSSFIIRAIIEEKASKVVETLMVSVKPLATVAGKVLAVMTYSFTMICCMVLSFCASYFIAQNNLSEELRGTLSSLTSSLNLSPFTVLFAFISLLIAFFTFAAISAIRGGGCSSMEDSESANLSVVMIVLVVYIASVIITPIAGMSGVFSNICAIIPLLSSFCALPLYVTGAIGLPVLIISWVVQAALGLFLIRFGAKVYNFLIVYNGAKLNTSDIIRIFRGKELKVR